ncbi:o-succinylbenzoate synthase [Bacillus infantis]|uniref:o-succinylbenzoate synthase n=1 Tax=Bacillus infantis TaxID=324767 RepID=UPI00101D4D9A|nr:o-succinylbenzoate synthase [Bacillus infantis]RYI25242.1 o-succinylbenzoate synthase [Bacillus infantis]
MNIKKAVLHVISMQLKKPFSTHLGTVSSREAIIIELIDRDGLSGFGEAVAFSSPWYTEETVRTCYHVIKDFLLPLLKESPGVKAEDAHSLFSSVRRNQMAKAGLESALWDLQAKQEGTPLHSLLGGTRSMIGSGVAVGAKTVKESLLQIEGFLQQGYRRIKVKISPENDLQLLSAIRKEYPDIDLMADANSAYTFKDKDRLKALDEFRLLMIEQPLAHDDIIDHSVLQKSISTPICLDESIVSFSDARKAAELGSCKVINIKPGRVGGLSESKQIHDYCLQNGIQVWCGGMIEFGVSRAHNIALASLPGFEIPGDISGSERYWEQDIITPGVTVEDGFINVPEGPGIGFEINRRRLAEVTLKKEAVSLV